MKRSILRAALCSVLLLSLSVSLAAETTLERVKRTGELRIGTDATYPPFETAEGDQFTGFDIDIANAIAQQLGVRAVYRNSSFDGIFPALQNGTFDLVISAVTITPERSAAMLFSDPYYDAGQLLVTRSGVTGIDTPDDLPGKRVGVQINTTGQFEVEKRQIEPVKYNSIDLALLDLRNGRVEVVVGDAPTLRYMIRQSFRDLRTVGSPFTRGEIRDRDGAGAALRSSRR